MEFHINKSPLLTFLTVALISLSYFNLTFTDGDEGRYLFLAKAIASGHGQTDIHLPEPKAEVLTPPGYPHILSLVVSDTNQSILGPKIISWLAYLGYSLIIVILFNKLIDDEDKRMASILALIALLPVPILIYTWSIFAETLYLFTVAATLFIVIRGDNGLKEACVVGLLITLATAIRPVGVALIPAIGLHYIWRRKWMPLTACALTFLISYAPIILFTYKAIGMPFGYMSYYVSEQSLSEKILQLIQTISTILPHYIFSALPQTLYFALFDGDCLLGKLHLSLFIQPLSIGLGLIVILGFLLRIKKMHFFDLYALVYAPMASSSHIGLQRGIEDRYLLPLLPHAVFYLYIGLKFLLPKIKIPTNFIRLFFILSLIYTVLTAVGVGALRIKHEWHQRHFDSFSPQRHLNIPVQARQAFGRYLEAGQWIKENTEPEAFVVSRKPRHTYLVSGRKGFRLADVRLPAETPFETICKQAKHGPLYILQDAYPEDTSYGRDRLATIDPMLIKYGQHFSKLHVTEAPETVIWKLKSTIQPLPTP